MVEICLNPSDVEFLLKDKNQTKQFQAQNVDKTQKSTSKFMLGCSKITFWLETMVYA